VLESGGAYVPLDPAYPRERLAFMAEDAGLAVVVTQAGLLEVLPPFAAPAVCLDRDGAEVAAASAAPLAASAGPDNLAYVIYTSGSTGRPKGVAIAHASATALVRWAGEAFAPAELAVVLFSTSICFDLSVFELFVPLARGGRVVVVENALALPGAP